MIGRGTGLLQAEKGTWQRINASETFEFLRKLKIWVTAEENVSGSGRYCMRIVVGWFNREPQCKIDHPESVRAITAVDLPVLDRLAAP